MKMTHSYGVQTSIGQASTHLDYINWTSVNTFLWLGIYVRYNSVDSFEVRFQWDRNK